MCDVWDDILFKVRNYTSENSVIFEYFSFTSFEIIIK